MATLVPGNFDSTIDTGLPISPSGETKEDLQSAYNAIQILQRYLTIAVADIVTLKARLAAAGIP